MIELHAALNARVEETYHAFGFEAFIKRDIAANLCAFDIERDAARVIAAVEAAKRSADWAKDGGAFIPTPLVWLNQSRWEAATESENAPDVIANAEARRTAEYLEAQERHRQAAIDPEAMARHMAALQGVKERALGIR